MPVHINPISSNVLRALITSVSSCDWNSLSLCKKTRSTVASLKETSACSLKGTHLYKQPDPHVSPKIPLTLDEKNFNKE